MGNIQMGLVFLPIQPLCLSFFRLIDSLIDFRESMSRVRNRRRGRTGVDSLLSVEPATGLDHMTQRS